MSIKLRQTAEAYMSLGNVSSPRVNEQHFRRAIELLRAAASIEGYSLNPYLQQYEPCRPERITLLTPCRYLDDYGRYLDD